MNLNYKCCVFPNSDALNVLNASDYHDDDGLSFVTRINDPQADPEIVLSKQDAIDLAWSVLEHYNVTKRPDEPIKVGDFIKVVKRGHLLTGMLGRVVQVSDHTVPYISLNFTDLAGEPHWVRADYVKRLTPAEFKIHVNTRVAEMMVDVP